MCDLRRAMLVVAVLGAAWGQHTEVDEGGDDDFVHLLISGISKDPQEVEAELNQCDASSLNCKNIDQRTLISHATMIEVVFGKCYRDADLTATHNARLGDPDYLNQVFLSLCSQVSTLSICLNDAHERLKHCVCDVEIEVFSNVPSALSDVLYKECKEKDGKFGEIANDGSLDFWKEHVNELSECVKKAHRPPSDTFKDVKTYETSLLGRVLAERHAAVKTLKKCVHDLHKGNDETGKYFDHILGRILGEMKCVKDKNNNLGPCPNGGSRHILPGLKQSLGLAIIGLAMTWIITA